MLKNEIQRLSELSRQVEDLVARTLKATPSAGRTFGGNGRFGNRPTFQNWRVNGTRPRSDRGVTFHLKHSFVTKNRHISASLKDMTSAAQQQSYIERNSAIERLPDGQPISIGNLGGTKAERIEFWRMVERIEARNGRVQCRVIGELPHELGVYEHHDIVKDLADIFALKNLPHWVCVHGPSKQDDDPRNVHFHLVYYDRPSTRTADGRWDFEVLKEVKYGNGTTNLRRPMKQKKDRSLQSETWIRDLRRTYADIANFHLALNDVDKRYDPRSYQSSGIIKRPTIHLGTSAAALESRGIETAPGTENAQREATWRLKAVDHLLLERLRYSEAIMTRLAGQEAATADGEDARQKAIEAIEEHRDLAIQAIAAERRRELHQIATEMLSMRLDQRSAWIEKSVDSLMEYSDPSARKDSWLIAESLKRELTLIGETRDDIDPFIQGCEKVIVEQTELAAKLITDQDTALYRAIQHERTFIAHGIVVGAQVSDADPVEIQRAMDIAAGFSPRKSAEMPTIEVFDTVRISRDRHNLDLASPAGTTPQRHNNSDPPTPAVVNAQQELASKERPPGNVLKEDIKTQPRRTESDHLPAGSLSEIKTDREDPAPRPKRPLPPPERIDISPEEAAVRAMLGTTTRPMERGQTHQLPDTFAIDLPVTARAVRSLELELAQLPNLVLRARTRSTRDAADLSDTPEQKGRYKAALRVMTDVAERRGLDLETGIHNPKKATDPNLAHQHTDSARRPKVDGEQMVR